MKPTEIGPKVEFRFESLGQDVPALVEPFHFYLNVTGDFAARVDDEVVYSEEMFTVVEFAIQTQRWQRGLFRRYRDFIFTSMEAEGPLLWIKRPSAGGRGRVIGSVDCRESKVVPPKSIKLALDTYHRKLREDVEAKWNYDIDLLFQWPGVRNSF